MRLYSILSSITTKLTNYNAYINKLCNRFCERRDITYTVTPGTNYTINSTYFTIWGGLQRIYVYATRSSNFSAGNITNETFCTLEIQNDEYEQWRSCSIWARNLGAGNYGGLKSYYCTTANSSNVYRAIQVCSVATADASVAFHTGPVAIRYPDALS